MNKDELAIYKKLSPEDLQGLLALRRRGGKHSSKKGKGSYDRKKVKRESEKED